MTPNIYQNKSKSFGLVEVLLSAMIFVILIGGISILVQRSIASSVEATNRQIALNYAQEGIEAVKQINPSGLPALSINDPKMYYPSQIVGSPSWQLTELPVATDFSQWPNNDMREPYGNDNIVLVRLVKIEKFSDPAGFEYYQIQCKVAWDARSPISGGLFTGHPQNSVSLSTIIVP